MVNDVTRIIQIPSKRLKKDTGAQVNNSTFIFIADKVFGLPVYRVKGSGRTPPHTPHIHAWRIICYEEK